MNEMWFECGIRYEKMQENGIAKKVTELYLVKGISFSDAESRVIKEIESYISGDFTISTMRRANYTEIIETNDISVQNWFKCKVFLIAFDEKKGIEKKTPCYMLVKAASIEDAHSKLNGGMRGTVSDYQLSSVSETKIHDIIF